MRTLIPQLVFGAIVTVAGAQVPAQAAAGQQTRSEAAFITGGVGADERERLKAVEKDFNLKLVFADPGGHLLAGAMVVVKDSSGKVVLQEPSGPVFLAKLPAGTYTVDTAFDDKKQTRKITVGKKLTSATVWFSDVAGIAMR